MATIEPLTIVRTVVEPNGPGGQNGKPIRAGVSRIIPGDAMTTRDQLEAAILSSMEHARGDVTWGKDDCALWCADIIRSVLPYDPAAEFRGRYTTRRGAKRVLGSGGLPALARRLARRHKWKRVNPDMALPGDLGLAWTDFQGVPVLATVICRAFGWFVGRGERGFSAMRAEKVTAAWSLLSDNAPGARVGLRRINKPWEPRTSAVAHEPISGAIGLTALLAGGLEAAGVGAFAAGVIGSAVGGAIVGSSASLGISIQPGIFA